MKRIKNQKSYARIRADVAGAKVGGKMILVARLDGNELVEVLKIEIRCSIESDAHCVFSRISDRRIAFEGGAAGWHYAPVEAAVQDMTFEAAVENERWILRVIGGRV